jgi:hypothetical protein
MNNKKSFSSSIHLFLHPNLPTSSKLSTEQDRTEHDEITMVDGPFGDSADVGVGFSDVALLIVSGAGFIMLVVTVYGIVMTQLKTKEELDDEEGKERSYEDHLARADVSTLNRAERRARARVIMKQQRRADADPTEEEEAEDEHHGHLSRRERQKAAKAAEREERKLFEEDRRKQQQEAQEVAQKEKKEREREEAKRAEEQRVLDLAQKETREKAELDKFKTFLSSPSAVQSQSVDEFVSELNDNKCVYIDQIATKFGLSAEVVISRIKELINERRVAGIIEADGRFIYFSDQELQAIASQVKSLRSVSTSAFTDLCNNSHNIVA